MMFLVLSSLFFCVVSSTATSPQVRIDAGLVRGRAVEGGARAFEGIPYAERPRRLEKPVRKAQWEGVRDATTTPLPCVQQIHDGRRATEDCLTLTVVAPEKSDTKYPVVVVVHGGAFSVGAADELSVSDTARHMVSRGLVVVAIQYRLGVLGFCSTGDATMPGNYGLFDVKMAFEWVRDNIAAFGGDPESITAYGGSAGAGLIGSMLLSEQTDKLFHKMIVFSGATRDQFKQDVKGSCKRHLQERGMDVSSSEAILNAIRSETNVSLLETGWQHFTQSAIESFDITWGPVIDGELIKSDFASRRASAPRKPMMIGVADLEGAGFTFSPANWSKNTTEWRKLSNRLYQSMVPKGSMTDDEYTSLIYKLNAEYDAYANKQLPGEPVLDKMRVSFQKAFGEKVMVSVVYDEIEYFLKKNGDAVPVYLYNFRWHNDTITKGFFDIRGAFHGMDQHYAINQKQINGAAGPNDAAVRDLYIEAIANFARTSDPNPSVLKHAKWEKITAAHPTRNFQIDVKPEMQEHYFNGRPARIRNWTRAMGKTTPL